ncbi:hypothetical protein [Glaciibacter psychrotolerans]|uniref:Uncharacterized protein n=1 Tax=Glaciibacter psychrotolerans TaxID=670054 RepID=A0A7Z0EFV9_9MICO|nr:hypothetical protein [Leifsonia psychrotolerans]
MTAVIAASVPLAAGLYLLVTVSWSLGERLILRRRRGPTAGETPVPVQG